MKAGTFAARAVSKQPTTKEDAMRRFWILAAVAALALVPAACSGSGADEGGGAATGAGDAAEVAGGATTGGGSARSAVPAAAEPSSSLPSLGPRIVQTASLSLSVPRNRFEEAVENARTLAAGLGGFVVSSSASQGSERRLVSGSLVLRIPQPSYAQAMKALSALGRVEAQEETGQDVSQEFVDLQARSRHLEAVERQLLQFLNDADNVPAALAVQSRLEDVQLELERVRGRLRFLDDQVAFATISLHVHERLLPVKPQDDGRGIVDSWRSAAHWFVTVVGWIFVGAATVAPLVLLLLVAFAAARLARRTMPMWRRS
jgi:uncharacterized protein DUF4349